MLLLTNSRLSESPEVCVNWSRTPHEPETRQVVWRHMPRSILSHFSPLFRDALSSSSPDINTSSQVFTTTDTEGNITSITVRSDSKRICAEVMRWLFYSCRGLGLRDPENESFCHLVILKLASEELDIPVLRAVVVRYLSEYLERQVPLTGIKPYYEHLNFDTEVEQLIVTSLGQALGQRRFGNLDEYAAYGRTQNKPLFDAVCRYYFVETKNRTERWRSVKVVEDGGGEVGESS